MARCLSVLAVSFCLGILSQNAFAQKRSQFNGKYVPPFGVISFTGSLGVAYYYGDLNDKPGLKNMGLGPAVSLGALYRVTEHFSARGELRFYQVSGNQQYSSFPNDNLSFRARNPDLSLGIQADLFAYNRRARINPYLFLGVAASYLNTKTKLDGKWYSLPPLSTEGVKYSRLPLAITGAAGVSVQATERLSLGVELNSNFMLSDYLDDVSTVYANPDVLPSDLARRLADRSSEIGLPQKEAGWHRGVGSTNDIYSLFQVRVTYLIGTRLQAIERKKTRCPKF
jgi:opacity protein-like surface antigen